MKNAIFAACLTISFPALALDIQEAKSNVGLEFAECGNYYVLVREGADRSLPSGPERDKAMADQQRLAEFAFQMAAELANQEIALARIKFSMESMRRKMHNSFEYLSVVAAEYAFPCKDLMEAPDKRLQFWLKKN